MIAIPLTLLCVDGSVDVCHIRIYHSVEELFRGNELQLKTVAISSITWLE